MGFAHLKIRHMLTFIKRIYKYIYYNFLYKKKVYIRFNTNIDLISSFGIDCIVEEGGRVSASNLGNSVKIDQFAISKSSTLGNFVSLHKQAIISFAIIDSYSYIGQKTHIHNASIGKFCSIGPEVRIGLGIHPTDLISSSPVFYSASKQQVGFSFTDKQLFEEYENCTIGNDVWIGVRAIILDGVKIGDGAIIGANSVVTKDVAPYSIVGGVPAKHIRFRFGEEKINEINELQWWDWPIEKLEQVVHLFQREIK